MSNDLTTGAGCISPETIVDFLAGELGRDEGTIVEKHLADCTACRKEAEGFRELVAIVGSDEREAKCDVVDAVMAQIKGQADEEPVPAGRVVHFVWGFMRAAALLIFALTLGIMVRGLLNVKGDSGSEAAVAVNDAAKWLISVQDETGSWDPATWGGRKELRASLTGLAMLTILRSDVESAPVLAKAEKYLHSIQNDDGSFGPECVGKMYNHGIASKALLAMRAAGKGTDNGAVEKAMDYVLAKQSPAGGWSYSEDDSRSSSVGVSVWQLDALLAGRAAGIDGLDRGVRKGFAWMKGVYGGNGDFSYKSGRKEDELSSTVKAMSAMCLLSAGQDVLGLDDSAKAHELLAGVISEGSESDLYRSYFLTSAASAGKRKDVVASLEGMRNAIAGKRIIGGINAGSWNADGRWGSVGGRIYATSMAALSLSTGRIGEI